MTQKSLLKYPTKGSDSRAQAAIPICLGILLLASVTIAIVQLTLWPLILLVGVILVVALAISASWTLSIAATVVLLLFGQAILMPIFPHSGLPLHANNVIALLVAGATGLIRIWVNRQTLRAISKNARYVAGAVLVVPFLSALVGVATVLRYDASKISWAMANDSVWNTMSSRFIVEDNGLLSSTHPNPSPLANEIMASILSVGRVSTPAGGLLEHDISREIQVLMFVTAATSVLASLLVSRTMSASRPGIRSFFSIGAGLLPWTWFIGGFAFRYGFYNVTVAALALVALWLVWIETEKSPYLGTFLLFLSATVILAIWAPLVLLPGGLAVAATISHRESILNLRMPKRLLWLVGPFQLTGYALLMTLPDLLRDGKALADNGAMIDITTFDVIAMTAILFAVVFSNAARQVSKWELLGVVVVLVAGAAAMAYLISQRLGINEAWGYYPAKLGWFVCILAVFIVAASSAGLVNRTQSRGWIAGGGQSISTVLIVVAMLIQIPPTSWSLYSLFPALSITRANGMSSYDMEARELFAVSDPSEKNLFVRYFPTSAQDLFANGWLLQQPSDASSDPLRSFAYTLDTADSSDVCAAVTTWGGDVNILTRDVDLEDELAATCDRSLFHVEVVPSAN